LLKKRAKLLFFSQPTKFNSKTASLQRPFSNNLNNAQQHSQLLNPVSGIRSFNY